jgi:hypothetical protein
MQMILPVAFDTAVGPLREKAAYRLAHAQELAGQVDVEHGAPVLQAHVRDRGILLDPGIRDENVDASERLDEPVEHRAHLVIARYVGLERNGLAALIPDLADEIVGGARLGAVVHADRRARSGEGARAPLRCGAATRNESLLVLQRPCGG